MRSGEAVKFKVLTTADTPARELSDADARRQAARVEAIARAQHELAVSDADEQALTARIAEMAQDVLAADGAAFGVLEGNGLRVRSVYGVALDQVGTLVPLEGSLSGLTVCSQRILRSDDVDTDRRVHRTVPPQPWKSIMCAPLRQRQETVGVISVMSLQPGFFTQADETALELLAESLGAVLQRRRHAAQLAASESQYKSLFIDNPQPMCVYDPGTLKFLAVNAAWVAQYGRSEAEFLAMSIEAMRPPEDVEAWRREMAAKPLVGPARRRGRHQRKNGEVIHVDTFSNDILFEGRAARLVLAIDITEQLDASDGLRRSEARFRALTELSVDWYWEQDAQFRFIAIEGGGSTYPPGLLPPGQILGKARWELEDTEADEDAWVQHRAQLERHEPFRDFVVRRRIADGSVRQLALAGVPVFDGQGRFTGYRGVGRDITDQRRAQDEIARLNAELEERVGLRTAQLEAANAELEAFSYSIAHDLRSPLTSIDGFSHSLDELCSPALGEQGRHYVRRIRAGVRQMSELTDAMLSLAQLSRVRLRWEPVDLAEIARKVFAQLREGEPHREGTLETPSRLPAHGDPRLLAQVVANLVGNAWKFSAHKPIASIRFGCTKQDAGDPVYFVADNGAGFDMAHASRLFGAFQRLHSPSEFDGTGIGLALVQKIVTRHGGRIWAHAVPGRGATFYFTLADEPLT
ncbi:ATP-binding protein [Ramlibacter sp. WS9]|uniref:ATP-binding protein n=1 Tax=Ramlibacter sp. WS9 TaxID=1882741 RepID=UPI001142D919|nr:ATP-binding protein [Ramlibacter sp. WS9]ROZ64869.1 PAS domain S-box protein [Ramlibacter sp. WS9]